MYQRIIELALTGLRKEERLTQQEFREVSNLLYKYLREKK